MKSEFLIAALIAAAMAAGCTERPHTDGQPPWLIALLKQQSARGGATVEESIYQGRKTYLVMPGDRGSDTGDEHVLYSQDGKIICEFGGFVGQVTKGSCDIDAIKFVRTLAKSSK